MSEREKHVDVLALLEMLDGSPYRNPTLAEWFGREPTAEELELVAAMEALGDVWVKPR